MDLPELQKLYLMKRNQIEMMKTRGYKLKRRDEEILDMNLYDFIDYIENLKNNSFVDKILSYKGILKSVKGILEGSRGLLSYEYTKEGEKIATCAIVYITREGDGRIEKSFTNSLMSILKVHYTDIILITDRPLTQDSKHIISSVPMVEEGFPRTVWLFRDEELYVNPLTHKLSPKYEILNDEESKDFKRRYINPLLISVEDPAIKFYGWKVNSVVKITRDISVLNANVENLVTKRLIVKGAIVRDIAE